MGSTGPSITMEQQLREVNEALLVSSVRQHELTERAERAETASAHLAAIITSSNDAIISMSQQGIIRSWNAAAQRLFGYTAEEAIGKPSTLLIPPDRIDEEPGILERAGRGESVEHYETVRQRKNGSLLDISLTVSPIRDADGRIVGAAKIARDITDRKRAEALILCQKQSLEMLVQGEPLERMLDFLARSIEDQSQGGFLVAIYLLEEDGDHFGFVAAPSLPASYAQATRGMDARLELGPCSSAVVSREPTVVRDFSAQARWPAFSAEAIALGLRGCFTTPIVAADQTVLGTFTIYYREPCDPSPNDRQLVDIVTHTVAIAIELKQSDQSLREAEQRFRNLADNIPQLAWIADAATDGEVHWFNQNWYDYTGTTLDQMRGSGWHAVHHPEHAERVIRKFSRHVREGLDWEDTFPLRGKDGGFRWFLSRMKVIRDESGKAIWLFGTNTDVTEQRQMADELRQNAADMSEADCRKNEFLAMLAHELRNPLAPIRNALQIIRMNDRSAEAMQLASEMMERQVGQMVRLVDDLLDVSRISRGKIELRRARIELASVIHHVVEACRPSMESNKHELTVTLPPEPIYLNADPTRLAQVVGNLLTNACKFTDQGGRIGLSLAQEGEQAVVRVQDNGVGIAPDQLSRVFDMFTQIDTSMERSVGGLGIGLTLVQTLVELHGGSVEVHSPGVAKGSEFVVRLPVMVGAAEPPSPPPTASEPALPTARRILVVDDNRDSAATLAMLLEMTGNETQTAHDGLEAVEAADTFRPDVVLLDIGLPKMNGFDAARKIREQPWGKDMVLVALTGWGQEEDRKKSKEAGFNGHMVKPVSHAALTKLLAELLPAPV